MMEPRPLKDYRYERLETVDEFAAFLGIALDTLYRIQRGEGAHFSTMKKVAAKLGVHPFEIEEFASKRERIAS